MLPQKRENSPSHAFDRVWTDRLGMESQLVPFLPLAKVSKSVMFFGITRNVGVREWRRVRAGLGRDAASAPK